MEILLAGDGEVEKGFETRLDRVRRNPTRRS